MRKRKGSSLGYVFFGRTFSNSADQCGSRLVERGYVSSLIGSHASRQTLRHAVLSRERGAAQETVIRSFLEKKGGLEFYRRKWLGGRRPLPALRWSYQPDIWHFYIDITYTSKYLSYLETGTIKLRDWPGLKTPTGNEWFTSWALPVTPKQYSS